MPLYLHSINITGARESRHCARAPTSAERRCNIGLRVAECISAPLRRRCIHRPDRDRTVVSRSMLHVLGETRSIVAQAVCKLANFRCVARYQKRPPARSLARPPRRNLVADITATTLRPCTPMARSSLRFTASLLAEYFRDVKTFVASLLFPSLSVSPTLANSYRRGRYTLGGPNRPYARLTPLILCTSGRRVLSFPPGDIRIPR